MDVDEVECLICQDPLFQKAVVALTCGHVYHRECVLKWLEHRCECPQCKKKTNFLQVRDLKFQDQLQHSMPEDVDTLLDQDTVQDDEFSELQEKLVAEQQAAVAESEGMQESIARLECEAEGAKAERLELAQQQRLAEEDSAAVAAELAHASHSHAELLVSLDAQAQNLHRRLPIKQVRENDPDLLEERRKLRTMRPADRARHLHEVVVSAIQRDAEISALVRELATVANELDDKSAELRAEELRLRQRLQHLHRRSTEVEESARGTPRSTSTSQLLSSQTSASASSSAADVRHAGLGDASGRPPRRPPSSLAASGSAAWGLELLATTPSSAAGGAKSGAAGASGGRAMLQEPDSMLYGGAPASRRGGAAALAKSSSTGGPASAIGGISAKEPSAKAGATGGAKWGALFGQTGSTLVSTIRPVVVTQEVAPKRARLRS